MSRDLEEPLLCGKVGTEMASPGVWVEGVEGELGIGPVVLAVPELLAGPEDDPGCFLFRPSWPFEALNKQEFQLELENLIKHINLEVIYGKYWGPKKKK